MLVLFPFDLFDITLIMTCWQLKDSCVILKVRNVLSRIMTPLRLPGALGLKYEHSSLHNNFTQSPLASPLVTSVYKTPFACRESTLVYDQI